MSYIPDTRTHEGYNQKYLNSKDAEFVAGFDWCRIMAVENFAENADMVDDIFEELEAETEEEQAILDKLSLMDSDSMQEVIIKSVINKALEWIECQRDELIVSMIENMSEEEFEDIKAKVDAGEWKNNLSCYKFEKEDQEQREKLEV